MKRTLLGMLPLLMSMSAIADTKGKTTYVGDGRYSCAGNTTECAVTRQRNEQLEEVRRNRRELETSRQNAETKRRHTDQEGRQRAREGR